MITSMLNDFQEVYILSFIGYSALTLPGRMATYVEKYRGDKYNGKFTFK